MLKKETLKCIEVILQAKSQALDLNCNDFENVKFWFDTYIMQTSIKILNFCTHSSVSTDII